MANLFQKRKLLCAVLAEFLILIIIQSLSGCAQNEISTEPTDTPTLVQEFSTPQLIEQAYAKGEITAEYRLLYLAYAVYEYESLPVQFRGDVGWRATSVVAELYEAVDTPSILCSMSPYVRSEFQRLLKPETTCG